MADELLKLKWNGHLSSFLQIFQSLRIKGRYTDVTLACEGRLFTVHRLVLASCSQFFDHIFEQTPSENTVIILNEAKAHDIESLLDYMYCGQVDVQQRNLASFIRTAKCLQIKGLATPEHSEDHDRDKRSCESEIESSAKKKRISTVPPLHPTVLSPVTKPTQKRYLDESPPKATSPSSVHPMHNRWVFQRSDLPNTTWSSSQGAPEGDGPESEDVRPNALFGDEIWAADEPTSNASPHALIDMRRLQPNRPVRLPEEPDASQRQLPSNHFYKEKLDYQEEKFSMKTEVKQEQRDYNTDPEDFSNTDYSQNYNYTNAYDREDTSECFSNPALARRNAYESPSAMDVQNAYHQNRISQALALTKDIPATTSQATVSPKLMPYAKCSNCLTNNTKLWRRSMQGEIVCNACGLYYKLHGVNRPSHLFRNAPMTRRRNPRKKKKLYEEIAENREPNLGVDDRNESFCNESGCDDSDTQDGLAVLNAALTLNSLFAKAKAQEAAAAAAASAAAKGRELCPPPPPMNLSAPNEEKHLRISSSQEADPYPSSEPRPPPPLLKLPSSSGGTHSPINSYSSFPSSPRGMRPVDNSGGELSTETDHQGRAST